DLVAGVNRKGGGRLLARRDQKPKQPFPQDPPGPSMGPLALQAPRTPTGDPVEIGGGEGMAAPRENGPAPVFRSAHQQVEQMPHPGTMEGARRIARKWRLVAMVEIDRRK